MEGGVCEEKETEGKDGEKGAEGEGVGCVKGDGRYVSLWHLVFMGIIEL